MTKKVEDGRLSAEEDYDAVLILSFGGPRSREDVMPFLRNVVRGRNVPDERLASVAEHYYEMGGASPINERTQELVAAVEKALSERGPSLPVYLGNRFWSPLLPETVQKMADDGVKRALAVPTSAFSSYSGCRAYREDLERARAHVGERAPRIDKVRTYYNHPGYLETCSQRLGEALAQLPSEQRNTCTVLFSAHSIPTSMAERCSYRAQLQELSEIVANRHRIRDWELVYQSRSGPPQIPWLEPDVNDAIRNLATRSPRPGAVVVAPFGFVADHMEVVWDLDHEAKETAEQVGLPFVRARTANDHPQFIEAIRALIVERVEGLAERPALGVLGARPDQCPPDCCPQGRTRPRPG